MYIYAWLNKVNSFYMAAVVLIGSGCGLRIKAHHRNQPNQSNLALYKPLLSLNSHFKQATRQCFNNKGGCGGHGHYTLIMYLKEELD